MKIEELRQFYQGKRVLVTGHTGFKGSWLCRMLLMLGAEVWGYALNPPTSPNLYTLLDLDAELHSVIADIRDFESLQKCYREAQPDLVFHLAAQPIVRDSYKDPLGTYETNVMGTVHLLECMRRIPGARSFLNVTTDKVYENNEIAGHGFTEEEKLDGYDPYSNSKSCSELVTHSYQKAFFASSEQGDVFAIPAGAPRISTARAGNVIGGGDFANDRIVPDCVRATVAGRSIAVRNPYSTRPYQHVLEPLYVYLTIVMRQAQNAAYADCYNVGPADEDCITTGELADYFVKYWGEDASWENMAEENAPHEANFLKLDCAKLRRTFGWNPVWHVEEAIRETVEWYRAWAAGEDMCAWTDKQIRMFFEASERIKEKEEKA